MMFPAGARLHEWDLSTAGTPLDDLLRSCQQVSLTGFAEIKLSTGVGVILYYQGSEATAVFRQQSGASYQGQEALRRLRQAAAERDGTVVVYELPLEMAHVLRGITNRRRVSEPISTVAHLDAFLERLQTDRHTGMLEVQTSAGVAALLLVNGRMSNLYLERADGRKLERAPALQELQRALDGTQSATVFLSDFSRDVWKARHDVASGPPSAEAAASSSPMDERESALRHELLKKAEDSIPVFAVGMVVDLMTLAVLARRSRGASALSVEQLASRVPSVLGGMCEALARDGDLPELLELTAGHCVMVVVVADETHEALVVIADRAQPTAQITAAARRLVGTYAAGRRALSPKTSMS
jgi:hypothetical protein